MIISYATKKTRSKDSQLTPGVYSSEVVDVKTPKGYDDNQAFEIVYSLTDTKTGEVFEKSEIFYNDFNNPRTATFLSYLVGHGVKIETTDDLLGLKETLTFAYVTSRGRRFLNISHRNFVAKPAVVQPTPKPKTGK